MQNQIHLVQDPSPGSRCLVYSGDTLTFRLSLSEPIQGSAWIRTNLGYAAISRKERIRQVDQEETPLGRDWFDTPMVGVDRHHFTVTLPICEVGHFEAKCFFLVQGRNRPVWPAGANVSINVEPAYTCRANIIYNAFVRQFGPNRAGEFNPPVGEDTIKALDQDGYAVIPPSGTFRDLIEALDFIIVELGCRFLQLLPIHPTPTTYGRMGRFGSPYAALSFTAVDPALAVFDPATTPLEQFAELIDAVHARGGAVLIDVAINHTGWAAGLHESHPRWLVRNDRGQIEVPGAWGVRWEDLAKLDYTRKDLWQYMADVFLLWCRRGVDGFRCDAGYMIPLAAWVYIIARVREQFPDTIFLLEGLGGKISVTRELLDKANFNWAYSELFQNYDRAQIEHYLPDAINISQQDGVMVHFAETHDNQRLASRSLIYARMRTALCALSSHQGAFGFANGVEWYATEKINVHDARSLNWGAAQNQVARIRQLNRLLREHPAFGSQCRLELIQNGEGNQIVLLREHPDHDASLLVVVNLDPDHPNTGSWPAERFNSDMTDPYDLLSGKAIQVSYAGAQSQVALAPGQVLCLSRKVEAGRLNGGPVPAFDRPPEAVFRQQFKAKALEIFRVYNGIRDLGDFNVQQSADELAQDPLTFCRRMNNGGAEPRVTIWQWPADRRRVVMLPPGHFLLVRADAPFRARITAADKTRTLAVENGLPTADGIWFGLFAPMAAPEQETHRILELVVPKNAKSQHVDASLLCLPEPENIRIRQFFRHPEPVHRNLLFLNANDHGALLRAGVSWGQLDSKYDALLAASRVANRPDDRWSYLARCRVWLEYQGYSQSIGNDCLESFHYRQNTGIWHFHIPTGQGETVALTLAVSLSQNRQAVQLNFFRHPCKANTGRLADQSPVQLILRPDIDYRNFHETTKAYLGPEHQWPEAVQVVENGFHFEPEKGSIFRVQISAGTFIWEPDWQYMVHRPIEAERGLDSDSDLFSPGYFSVFLTGNQSENLTAEIGFDQKAPSQPPIFTRPQRQPLPSSGPPDDPAAVLLRAMAHFVVKRGHLQTVIAGYPWFLDWGRDALIFTRGLIAAGKTDVARDILLQFGRYEDRGTLPNMIRGDNTDNRDTSDAPLWFLIACRDLVRHSQNRSFLAEGAGRRKIGQVVVDLGAAMIDGTPNGIRMDPESGLIYSPAHYTWMDTDHPAGSPRQGYPIEIQALWFAALQWLGQIDPNGRRPWHELSQMVQSSIMQHFYLQAHGYLSDCLHAGEYQGAAMAAADDALRPNQLFAVTLGAVADLQLTRAIVNACTELLVPGGMRSLADRPVGRPIAIVHNGKNLNDPLHPYKGIYRGDEDTQRKPAYHNGTAWCWLLPTFCEAWVAAYGRSARITARSWLTSALAMLNRGCVGHIPEILDGDAPHTPRGCDAQAWSVSELLRVWLMTETGE